MTGPLALHGGGEFLPGDEPFLRHILELAVVGARSAGRESLRVELVTTAIARHRPDLAFAVGSAALSRVAAAGTGSGQLRLAVSHAKVVDAASARDTATLERLAAADLVYLPGGDPDAVLEILGGSPALEAIAAARARGAVVAGASAGAMAFGERTWTRDGYLDGFGWAGSLVVVPHAGEEHVAAVRPTVRRLPGGERLAILGLPERAGVVGGPGTWTVVGDGGAWWWPAPASGPSHEPSGSVIRD